MPEISREDAEAIVDGMMFTCSPVLARFAARPEMLTVIGEIEAQYNAQLRSEREKLIESLTTAVRPVESDAGQIQVFAGGDKVMLAQETEALRYGTGKVWTPNQDFCDRAGSTDPWTVAKHFGLTTDPQPSPERFYAMVAWDVRPGALQVHYVEELRSQ